MDLRKRDVTINLSKCIWEIAGCKNLLRLGYCRDPPIPFVFRWCCGRKSLTKGKYAEILISAFFVCSYSFSAHEYLTGEVTYVPFLVVQIWGKLCIFSDMIIFVTKLLTGRYADCWQPYKRWRWASQTTDHNVRDFQLTSATHDFSEVEERWTSRLTPRKTPHTWPTRQRHIFYLALAGQSVGASVQRRHRKWRNASWLNSCANDSSYHLCLGSNAQLDWKPRGQQKIYWSIGRAASTVKVYILIFTYSVI